MDHIFRDLINTGKVSIYIDDIVIHTKTLEEHWHITKEVLEILWTNKLYIKPEKCEIEKEKIEYLGVVVSEGRVEMDPVKTEALTVTVQLGESWDPWTQTRGGSRERWGTGSLPK